MTTAARGGLRSTQTAGLANLPRKICAPRKLPQSAPCCFDHGCTGRASGFAAPRLVYRTRGSFLSHRAQCPPRPRLEPSAGGVPAYRERVYQYRSRSRTRRHHLPAGPPISTGPPRMRRGDLVGHLVASDCNLRRSILVAHVCDRCRLSSILLASSLLNKPVFQFILAFLAQSSAQKSVLWWAAKHRHHHLHSDTEQDVHSPRHKGFVYSHFGWIFCRQHDATDLMKVSDFASYPELMWLHKFEVLPAVVIAGLCFLIAGWAGLVVGFPLEHRASVSRNVLHQLPRTFSRTQAVCYGR